MPVAGRPVFRPPTTRARMRPAAHVALRFKLRSAILLKSSHLPGTNLWRSGTVTSRRIAGCRGIVVLTLCTSSHGATLHSYVSHIQYQLILVLNRLVLAVISVLLLLPLLLLLLLFFS